MEDDRIWSFEEGLRAGDAEPYRDLIDDEGLMVVPAPPYVLGGADAIEAASKTPRWTSVTLSDRQAKRPEEGLIVIAYKAEAKKDDGETYTAHCTSVISRLAHEQCRVVQHLQTPPLVVQAKD